MRYLNWRPLPFTFIVWASVCLSVCPSVRPSVTLVICIKTVQNRITKSLLWTAPRFFVYCDKISCHWVQGFPSNEGVKEGYPLKRRHFVVIGLNNVETVADSACHACHNKHWWQAFWIDQHQWFWTTLNPSKEVFSEIFAIFGCSAHFNTELRRNGWR